MSNSYRWAALFCWTENKELQSIRLIFLPHDIERPVTFASWLIEYVSPKTFFLWIHKTVSSISLLSVLLSVSSSGGYKVPLGPTPCISCLYMSTSSMDTNCTNDGHWCHKSWVKDSGWIIAHRHCYYHSKLGLLMRRAIEINFTYEGLVCRRPSLNI